MKAFAYVNAANEKEAIAALGPERGRILPLAGGMDLLGLMKDYIAQPERLVNVKNLDRAIAKAPDGGLRIGAAATLVDLAGHAEAARMYPALVQAAAEVGTPQIRNSGTVGGNLNQRPRCWYFRNEEFACLKKGGSRCFAVDGENQFHAIFGGGPCHIVHPSSLAVPAVALGARFRIAGPAGEREVKAEDYFMMPDRNLFGETVLAPNELLTHVLLPAPGAVKSATYDVRYRQSHDWPLATASVALDMNGTAVRGARIVMGAVAPIPWRVPEAERALAGRTIDEQTAMAAADAAVAGAKPMSGNQYKVQIARTAVKRAILKAAGL
ncbi:MAG TPA: FAD binding domain-containing protein [Vicinamibacterales bacterium]|nr:FAD binding domain-containing protein [Vicinamibacterales bacterium]